MEKHKKIYEQYIGQTVPTEFPIHHLDGDHANNDIGNLVAIPRELHMYLHSQRYIINFPIYKELAEARERLNQQTLDYWIFFKRCQRRLYEDS